jgi:hypothetical protein
MINQTAPVFYQVNKGETLYRIAKQHFKLPVDTLLKWNSLQGYTIQPGQALYVGWMSLSGIPDSLRANLRNPMLVNSFELAKQYFHGGVGRKELSHRGAAYWQKENTAEASSMLALHRLARPGSILQVKNPMTGRVIFVKVVGTIPESAYRQDVVVVLSKKAARILGALDSRFFVEVKYY